MNTCEKCKFWVKIAQTENEGLCHRFPPMYHDYAECAGNDWCGEFQPACPHVKNV
jgi:hypothetical protein